jgi:23S rRNA (pseudouridine1915-N3)-methyltransferase
MLSLRIIAVGKLKERFWEDACGEYLKRLKRFTSLEIIQVADRDPAVCGGEVRGRDLEGADILAACARDDYVVVLDRAGSAYTSEQIAEMMEHLSLDGIDRLTFVIGGSTGLSPAVLNRSQIRMSLGLITLPHNLARVVLLEQIYRGFKILRGEPYHK